MKSNMLLGLAVLGLSALPMSAFANPDAVSYDDSMKCTTLYSYLADEAQDDDQIDQFLDQSFDWLSVAISRDGTEDGSRAEADADLMLARYSAEIGGMKTKKEAKALLAAEVQFCSGKQALIADEFTSSSN